MMWRRTAYCARPIGMALGLLAGIWGCGTNSFESLTVTGDADIGGTLHASAISGNSPLDLQTGGTSRIHVDDATGRVGIGTITPSALLHVVGEGQFDGPLKATAFSSDGPLQLQAGGTTRIHVDSATGRVGVGTATPDSLLTVVGKTQIYDAVSAVRYEGVQPESPIYLVTDNHARLFVGGTNYDGFVGINTIYPRSELDVWGGIRTSEYLSSANRVYSLEMKVVDDYADLALKYRSGINLTTPTTTIQKMRFREEFTRMYGDVGIGRDPTTHRLEVGGEASKTIAGDWLANSDARIKTDVETVGGALETLDRVRLVSFRYSGAYRAANPEIADRRYLNVIAQEFREVFPEYVRESNDKLPSGEPILQVDAYPLTIYAAAAVQELHRELKARDAKIADLEARLQAIETRLAGGTP